jgi:hypothetical protein
MRIKVNRLYFAEVDTLITKKRNRVIVGCGCNVGTSTFVAMTKPQVDKLIKALQDAKQAW